jgi:hypothetical protein
MAALMAFPPVGWIFNSAISGQWAVAVDILGPIVALPLVSTAVVQKAENARTRTTKSSTFYSY